MKTFSTKKKLSLLVLLVALLVSCSPTDNPDISTEVTWRNGGDIYRYYDAEADVVCWWFSIDGGYNGQGGLSCLPRSQTNLSAEQLSEFQHP